MTGKIVDLAAYRVDAAAGADAKVDAITAVEQHLLGTLLAKPALLEELPPGFGPRHFFHPDHGTVFDAIKAAAASGNTMVLPLVRAAVPHLDGIDAKGEPYSYVVSLLQAMVGTLPGMAAGYAATVMDASDRRELLAVASGMQQALAPVAGEPEAPASVISGAMLAFERVMTRQRKWRPAATLGEAMREAIARGEEAAARGGMSGVSTGLRCLDRRIGGMEPGTVTVLAARPGVGKTALGLRIGLNAALDEVPTEYISLEMPSWQMGRRALALASGANLGALKTGAFVEDTRGASEVTRGALDWQGLPFLIEDEASLAVEAIKLRAKAAKRRMKGLGLLIIDHLHIMGRPESAGRHGDTQAVTEMSAGVKALAKELEVPVLLLAQLNRGVEGREDKRPTLADLRQSGAIEQDADTIMFIYRKAYYTETREEMPKPRRRGDLGDSVPARFEGPDDRAEILFEKVRDGERGVEYLRYDAPRARFWEEGSAA